MTAPVISPLDAHAPPHLDADPAREDNRDSIDVNADGPDLLADVRGDDFSSPPADVDDRGQDGQQEPSPAGAPAEEPVDEQAGDPPDPISASDRAAEIGTIIDVDPASLRFGPHIRTTNLEPTAEEVKEAAKHGIEEPIRAYRDADGTWVIIKGKRRTLRALKAKCSTVPVCVQAPPPDDEKAATIDRVSQQYRLTTHRAPLGRVDEYEAFKQLTLTGLNVTAVSKELGVARKTVKNALLVGDSELASAAADKYEMTLDQAAEIVKCEKAGDLDAAKELIRCLAEGPHNFEVLAKRLDNDRVAARRLQVSTERCVKELTEAGVTILDDSIRPSVGGAYALENLRPCPEDEEGSDLAAENHVSCPGHSAWIKEGRDDAGKKIAVPLFGCADYQAHGHDLKWAPKPPSRSAAATANSGGGTTGDETTGDAAASLEIDPAEVEAAAELQAEHEQQVRRAEIIRQWTDQNNDDAAAARDVRRGFLAQFARRRSLPKQARRWMAGRLLAFSTELFNAASDGHALAHELLGLPMPESTTSFDFEGYFKPGELAAKIDTANDAKAAVYEMFLLLCAFEEGMSLRAWQAPTKSDQVYIEMLRVLGYQASDIDLKILAPEDVEEVVAAALAADTTADDAGAADGSVDDAESVDGAGSNGSDPGIGGVGELAEISAMEQDGNRTEELQVDGESTDPADETPVAVAA